LTIPGGGDLELGPGSPGINRGAALAEAGSYDMDGQGLVGPRDIGAYEAD
jgi:hypothetical protein